MSTRNVLLAGNGCLGVIAIFIGIGFSIYIGVESESWAMFLIFLAISTVGIGIALAKINKHLTTASFVNMDAWLSTVAQCQHKYAWDGFGVALDTSSRIIYLKSYTEDKRPIASQYSFSDVREWGYEIPGMTTVTAGHVVGGGLQGAGANIGNAIGAGAMNLANAFQAANNTGLWIRVKDINFPKWFIRFPRDGNNTKLAEAKLNVWMEIMEQTFNG